MRVKAVVSYDGSHYLGFQKQTSTKQTITYEIENALQSLKIDSNIVASGRTDAGVHASGQVIHFDIPSYWHDLQKLKLNLNRKLHDIHFKHISSASDDFHARFSAKKRLYRYVFKTSTLSVFEKEYISKYESFNPDLLSEALKYFIGEHDFDYFRKTGTQTHTSIRHIYKAYYKKHQGYHIIYFQANGFLRSQVRMMVDAAMGYAQAKSTLTDLEAQIACKKRYTTKLAPPQGLYLATILY
jgi:tRNA pseudouridine38-40 synthase